MVLPSYLRCLRTAHLPARFLFPPLTRPQSSPFTTTSNLFANPTKKATPQKGNQNSQKNQKNIAAKQRSSSNKFQHKKKKKDIVVSKRAYQEGQRKIIKKTIVLSNTNAPSITLPEMTRDLAGDQEAEGTVFEIPGNVIDKLRNIEAFKTGQHWPYFQKPSTLLRKESVQIGKLISAINDARMKGERLHERRILNGTKGSGRSIMLAQAMAWAFQSDWVVISIPNAQDLVIGHTDYEWDPHWNLWVQKEYTTTLLQRIFAANAPVFKTLKSTTFHKIGKSEATYETIFKLVDAGIQDPAISHDIFMALLHELTLPGRPPVLFTLDNLNRISQVTSYRDTTFTPIHAHDLAIPSTFLSHLNGTINFPLGLTIAATSSVSPRTPSLDLALRNKQPGPWDKNDPRIAPSIAGAVVLRCSSLKREEVKTLMDWYNAGGVYKGEVTLESVAEKFALSCGNPRELFKGCLRLKY